MSGNNKRGRLSHDAIEKLKALQAPLTRARDAILGGGPVDDDNLQTICNAIDALDEAILKELSGK